MMTFFVVTLRESVRTEFRIEDHKSVLVGESPSPFSVKFATLASILARRNNPVATRRSTRTKKSHF